MHNATTHIGKAKGSLRTAGAVLLMIVLLLIQGAFGSAKALGITSESTVAFRQGDLRLIVDKTEGSGLNFDFGRHFLPLTEVTYRAENDKPHLLAVEDGRVDSGNWYVSVKMTEFTEAGGSLIQPSFAAMIQLKNPKITADNGSVPVAGTGLTYSEDIQIKSESSWALVMEAPGSLVRGRYTMQWSNRDVTLNIGDSQVWRLEMYAYTSILSWQLTQGPR